MARETKERNKIYRFRIGGLETRPPERYPPPENNSWPGIGGVAGGWSSDISFVIDPRRGAGERCLCIDYLIGLFFGNKLFF